MPHLIDLRILAVLIGSTAILTACQKSSDNRIGDNGINGVAQKGPFTNGAHVTIAELDHALKATGKTFTTTITDNTGTFSLPNLSAGLVSKYVRLSVDGFYFDEVGNALSVSRIILDAVSDITKGTTINANLLTHLERPRIEWLIANGSKFADAKLQAQKEVLGIFGFSSSGADSETLDIAKSSDDNAILLAISSIIQARRSSAELTELLSAIANDLKEDGMVGSQTGTVLMNSAAFLNGASIRKNLLERYSMLGVTANIGRFEKYVADFFNSAKYPFTDKIAYPPLGANGKKNFLDPVVTSLPPGQDNTPSPPCEGSFRAYLPPGASLKVVLTETNPNVPDDYYSWDGPGSCWKVSNHDRTNRSQEFLITSSSSMRDCDSECFRPGPGAIIRVDYYENPELTSAATPTRTKTVTISGTPPPKLDGGVPLNDMGSSIDSGTVPDMMAPSADMGVPLDGSGSTGDILAPVDLPTSTG